MKKKKIADCQLTARAAQSLAAKNMNNGKVAGWHASRSSGQSKGAFFRDLFSFRFVGSRDAGSGGYMRGVGEGYRSRSNY